MNYFVSSHDAERKLRILISERIPFFSVKKKSKKKKKKKNKLLWDWQPAYLQDVSGLANPDGNWCDQNSVPSTLEYTWNSVKPTWADEIEALNIFIYIQKGAHFYIYRTI